MCTVEVEALSLSVTRSSAERDGVVSLTTSTISTTSSTSISVTMRDLIILALVVLAPASLADQGMGEVW